jgi:hypothetical protein
MLRAGVVGGAGDPARSETATFAVENSYRLPELLRLASSEKFDFTDKRSQIQGGTSGYGDGSAKTPKRQLLNLGLAQKFKKVRAAGFAVVTISGHRSSAIEIANLVNF